MSLPSDDNKLRRKWYARHGDGNEEAGNLDLPEARGELVPGGLGSTLRYVCVRACVRVGV